jgi:hypothetical protein
VASCLEVAHLDVGDGVVEVADLVESRTARIDPHEVDPAPFDGLGLLS